MCSADRFGLTALAGAMRQSSSLLDLDEHNRHVFQDARFPCRGGLHDSKFQYAPLNLRLASPFPFLLQLLHAGNPRPADEVEQVVLVIGHLSI